MREGIHPEYYQATVTCNCGNTFVTGSTKSEIHVEICSKCHPFYTGQQKSARADGRTVLLANKFGLRRAEMNISALIFIYSEGQTSWRKERSVTAA